MRLCFSDPRTGIGIGGVQCRWMKLMTEVAVGGRGGNNKVNPNEIVALVYSEDPGERALVVADLEQSWKARTTPKCFGPAMAVVAVPIPERDDYLLPVDLKYQVVSLFSVKYGRVVSEISCLPSFHLDDSVFDIGYGLFGVRATNRKQSVFDGHRDLSNPLNTITALEEVDPRNLFAGGGVMCLFNNNNNTATLVDPETSSILFSVSVGGHIKSNMFYF
ncbi:hypothetical protein Pelo_19253 [Pelomyxa schiedti]|nr:hypothetical protein Pelo_19253 [Pelomyxa schiedti]